MTDDRLEKKPYWSALGMFLAISAAYAAAWPPHLITKALIPLLVMGCILCFVIGLRGARSSVRDIDMDLMSKNPSLHRKITLMMLGLYIAILLLFSAPFFIAVLWGGNSVYYNLTLVILLIVSGLLCYMLGRLRSDYIRNHSQTI